MRNARPKLPARSVYDSRYAANVCQQLWRPRTHLPFIQTVIQAAHHVANLQLLKWWWLRGHRGNAGNIWADRLARMGAEGVCCEALPIRGVPAT